MFDPTKFGATPVATAQPAKAAAFDATKFGATAVPVNGMTEVPAQTIQPSKSILPGILTPEGSDLVTNAAKNVTDIYKNAPQDFIDQYIGPKSSQDPSAIKRVIGNSLGGAMSIMNTILAPITGTTKAVLDTVSKHIANNIDPNNPIVSKVVNFVSGSQDELAKLSGTHPEAVRNFGNAMNLILLGLAGGSEGGVGLDKPVGSIEGIAQGAKGALDKTLETAGSAKEGIGNMVVKSAEKEWAKPTGVPNASYNNATQIFDEAATRGHDIPKTLVNNGIKLSENIQDGKYVTSETAEQIRNDAGKMSHETLRPALEAAAPGVQKVPVEDIISKTISDVKKTIGSTAGDMESQIAKVTKEGEALLRKYPEGMDLVDLHDNKITYSKNGGYKFGDTPDTGNIKAVNRAFGRSLGGTLEKTAPEGIPVKQFNAELAKQYQAADYLDALNNKKVPVSIASKIAKTASKVVGAAVGEGLGGGIMGGVGGYHIGGMIESTFENMPNPFKEYFLNNLEKTNPEAFTKVSEYLGLEKQARMSRLLLPAPGETVQRAIPMGEGSDLNQVDYNAIKTGKENIAVDANGHTQDMKAAQKANEERLMKIIKENSGQPNETDVNKNMFKNELPPLKDTTEGKPFSKVVKKIPDQAGTKPTEMKTGVEVKPSEYRYHTTSPKNLESIASQGLKPTNGQYGKGVYFAPSMDKTGGYGSAEGAMIRIDKSKLPASYQEFPEQGWTDKETVPPKYLEVSLDKGKTWKPILQTKKK